MQAPMPSCSCIQVAARAGNAVMSSSEFGGCLCQGLGGTEFECGTVVVKEASEAGSTEGTAVAIEAFRFHLPQRPTITLVVTCAASYHPPPA